MKAKFTIIFILFSSCLSAQVVTIPDSYFKSELIYSTVENGVAKNANGVSIAVDANHNNQIEVSEALQVYELRLSNDDWWNHGIESLEGLQSFTNLTYFDNKESNLKTLVNFTGLINLKFIDLYGNFQIGSNGINVSGLTNLETLNCSLCNLVSINLAGLTSLVNIDLSINHLTSIDFTNLPKLKSLILFQNKLTLLNVDPSNSIENLDINFNSFTTFNSSLFQYLKYFNCSNNNLANLNLQGHTSLLKLTCNEVVQTISSDFFNLAGCTNLQELYCNYNYYLTGIHLQECRHLRNIQLISGGLTNVDFSNLMYLEDIDLSYTPIGGRLSVDIQGCDNLVKFRAFFSHLTELNASNLTRIETIDCEYCPLLSSVDLTNCHSLIYANFSSNLLTSLDLSDSPGLLELDCHYSHLSSLNLQNCVVLQKIICSNNPSLVSLDLSCSHSYTMISIDHCDSLTRVNLKNGFIDNPVFKIEFSPSLSVIGVDYNEFFPVFPATVSQTPYLTFTPNCRYNTLTGNVRYDIEGNGCDDDPGIENFKLLYTSESSWDTSYAFTNQQGDFIIYTQGDSLSVTPLTNTSIPNWNFGVSTPTEFVYTHSIDLLNTNLCLAPEGIHNDLEITIVPLSNARPGFDAKYKLVCRNNGTHSQSGFVSLIYNNSILEIISANPPISSQSTDTLNWNFDKLLPFESKEILFTLNVHSPTETPPVWGGDILHYRSIVTAAPDETPADNLSVLNQTVVNSFDPNDKTCLEGTTADLGIAGQYVHYIIRFENTGIAPAENIVVRDVIDPDKFDISTLYPVSASHTMYSRITGNNVTEFIFENINLPSDDANNDGYVIFKIRTKPTIANGNTFSNSADIYFDYNPSIATNNYVTTVQTVGLNELDSINKPALYPNPVKDILYFKTEKIVTRADVYDISGRILNSMAVNGNSINLSALRPGNYMLKIYIGNETVYTMIIKE